MPGLYENYLSSSQSEDLQAVIDGMNELVSTFVNSGLLGSGSGMQVVPTENDLPSSFANKTLIFVESTSSIWIKTANGWVNSEQDTNQAIERSRKKVQKIICQNDESITEIMLQENVGLDSRHLTTLVYSYDGLPDDTLIYGTDFEIIDNELNKIRIMTQGGYFVDPQGIFVVEYYV
jgi:hypothetical protein